MDSSVLIVSWTKQILCWYNNVLYTSNAFKAAWKNVSIISSIFCWFSLSKNKFKANVVMPEFQTYGLPLTTTWQWCSWRKERDYNKLMLNQMQERNMDYLSGTQGLHSQVFGKLMEFEAILCLCCYFLLFILGEIFFLQSMPW